MPDELPLNAPQPPGECPECEDPLPLPPVCPTAEEIRWWRPVPDDLVPPTSSPDCGLPIGESYGCTCARIEVRVLIRLGDTTS